MTFYLIHVQDAKTVLDFFTFFQETRLSVQLRSVMYKCVSKTFNFSRLQSVQICSISSCQINVFEISSGCVLKLHQSNRYHHGMAF